MLINRTENNYPAHCLTVGVSRASPDLSPVVLDLNQRLQDLKQQLKQQDAAEKGEKEIHYISLNQTDPHQFSERMTRLNQLSREVKRQSFFRNSFN